MHTVVFNKKTLQFSAFVAKVYQIIENREKQMGKESEIQYSYYVMEEYLPTDNKGLTI